MSEEKAKNMEETSMQIIWHAGNSKSCSMEALAASKSGNRELCQEKMNEARKELQEAHQVQTDLLHDFANGERLPVDILMVHAQDHLNGAMLTNDFCRQMIEMNEEIQALTQKLESMSRE